MTNPEWQLRSCNGVRKLVEEVVRDSPIRPTSAFVQVSTLLPVGDHKLLRNCRHMMIFRVFNIFYFKSGWIEIEWTQNPWSWTVIDLWWSQGYCYIIQCILNNICTVLRNLNFYFWHFFLNSSYTFFVKSLVGVCSDGPGVHVSANCSDRERSTNISHIANCEDAYESSSFLKKMNLKRNERK